MSKEEKNPYKNYSIEEIASAETGNYVIQVGQDFFSYNGKIGFNKQRAEKFYDDVLGGLNEMKNSPDEIEREDALKCLLVLKIIPLRIH